MMNEQETDAFFMHTINLIYEDLKECKAYVKDLHTPEYEEINQDYDDSLEELKEIIENINGIDDLAEQDDDIVDDVYYYLASWAGNFVISNKPEQKKKDIEEYNKIEELLNLFLDDDDFDEDYEEE